MGGVASERAQGKPQVPEPRRSSCEAEEDDLPPPRRGAPEAAGFDAASTAPSCQPSPESSQRQVGHGPHQPTGMMTPNMPNMFGLKGLDPPQLKLSVPGVQPSGAQSPPMPAPSMQPLTMSPAGIQPRGLQPLGSQAPGMQAPGIQPTGMPAPGMQAPGVQPQMPQQPGNPHQSMMATPQVTSFLSGVQGFQQRPPPPLLQNVHGLAPPMMQTSFQ